MNEVEGGGASSVDWDALAPHFDHPTRRAIVEALEAAGEPLSPSDLHARIGDPELPLSRVTYHAKVLDTYKVLIEIAERVTPSAFEPVFDIRGRS